MAKIIQVQGKDYILASTLQAEQKLRVLKHDDIFAVVDPYGEIFSGEEGLYYRGMRYLSHLEIRIQQERPLLLNNHVDPENLCLHINLTTPDLNIQGQMLKRGQLHIYRKLLLFQNMLVEELTLHHYGQTHVPLFLDYFVGTDFRDLFAIRGAGETHTPKIASPDYGTHQWSVDSCGRDAIERELSLTTSHPLTTSDDPYQLKFAIEATQHQTIRFLWKCKEQASTEKHQNQYLARESPPHENGKDVKQAVHHVFQELHANYKQKASSFASLTTSHEVLNGWLDRARTDIILLTSQTPYGHYPYAGTPWFSTVFGRDGIITALQVLWLNPTLARDVLIHLAATQADTYNTFSEAEPGKILHESRHGELANLGEIPYGKYYGTVDATPLFIILAQSYYHATLDRQTIDQIWPALKAAYTWIDTKLERSSLGFLNYARQAESGLVHQCWKDSDDSIYHADGRDALPPIATCEVQAYVYRAMLSMSDLWTLKGDSHQATQLQEKASEFRHRFHQAFWSDEKKTFVLALDGEGNPCAIRSSNAGHCLFCRIVEPEYAPDLCKTLMAHDSFCGWGIRTVAAGQARFNPMSYHNGSIWPHDNSMIAAGLAAYGFKDAALRIWEGLFSAAHHFQLQRMPELFCGFGRQFGESPILYPLSCAPQAWAAGSVFMLLQACLGLHLDARNRLMTFDRPALPEHVDRLYLKNLRLGADAHVSLELTKFENNVGVNVLDRHGEIDIAVLK